LRGIDVPVKAGKNEIKIFFQKIEIDTKYSVTIQPNWATMDWVTEKRPDGFSVKFSNPPTVNARIDWQLIR